MTVPSQEADMFDRIEEIDTGAIEELSRIKRDQEVLEGRLALMQERREGVTEVVFERVRGDYRKRHEALEEEARPLKERARAEFAKLQALLADIQQGRDDARLAKEELEFRNALGEFVGKEFDQQASEAAERLDQRESELAEVEAMRERFFAAVRSREELEHQEAAVLPPPVVPHAAAADAEGAPGVPAQPVPLAEAEADPEGYEAQPITDDVGSGDGAVEADQSVYADAADAEAAEVDEANEANGAIEANEADEGTEVEGSRFAPELLPPSPTVHAGDGEPLPDDRFGDAAVAVDEVGEPATAVGVEEAGGPATERTALQDIGVGEVELSREAGPGEGAMEPAPADPERTSFMDRTGDVLADLGPLAPPRAAPLGPAPADADDDEWHEAPTGSFEVPPLPPGPAPGAAETNGGVAADEDLGGATRILSRPRLMESGEGGGPREHMLALGRTSIGRASDNLVHLLDEAVSRHHAEIVPGPHGFLLRDLGSENGIFVNGERLPEHVLHDGDVIQIGARTLVYREA
jgi:hypothetical protein